MLDNFEADLDQVCGMDGGFSYGEQEVIHFFVERDGRPIFAGDRVVRVLKLVVHDAVRGQNGRKELHQKRRIEARFPSFRRPPIGQLFRNENTHRIGHILHLAGELGVTVHVEHVVIFVEQN